MINKVSIRNFKSLREVDIELERFTVFVGANGIGKTSVLGAIHKAVRAATGDPQTVFTHERHGDWIFTRGGRGFFDHLQDRRRDVLCRGHTSTRVSASS